MTTEEKIEMLFRSGNVESAKLAQSLCHKLRISYYIYYFRYFNDMFKQEVMGYSLSGEVIKQVYEEWSPNSYLYDDYNKPGPGYKPLKLFKVNLNRHGTRENRDVI